MKIHKVFILLLAVTLAAGLAVTPALAGDTAKEICEGNGGLWFGDNSNGTCYYPVNNPLTLAECSPPDRMYQEFELDVESDPPVCQEYDPTDTGEINGTDCFLMGGVWDNSGDPWTCTVSHTLFGECPGTTIYYAEAPYNFLYLTCDGSGGGGSSSSGISNPGYGKFGGKIESDEAGSIHLGGNKNGSLYYNAGTCASGCIFSPNLPAGAANSLPGDAIATLYVRIADGSNGSYNVCFDAGDLTSPVVYRYVGGAWVAQPVFFSGGQVCTTASGDGSFALGGS